MEIVGIGKKVRIYFGESDRHDGTPLYLALLEALQAEGCSGAIVLRGIAGFGAHSRIHTATLLRLSEDLPIVVEWVDLPERVDRLLPRIQALLSDGLITVEEVRITTYRHRRQVDDVNGLLRAADVMTREVVTVRPDLPLRAAVELLIRRDYRALPVVDEQRRVIGLVTNRDLIERGGLGARVDLLAALSAEQLAAELAALETGKTVADVMTHPVVTVGPDTLVADVAHLMVSRGLKRLPVVDPSGVLLGMISRVDLLRTRAEGYPRPAAAAPPHPGHTVGEIARPDVPVVRRDAGLADVLDAIVATPLNAAIVVDEPRRVVGVVTDAELLRRLSPEDHPGVVRVLMSRLPFVHLSPEEKTRLAQALGTTAGELMDPSAPVLRADASLGEAIAVMLRERRQILPVVDRDGQLVGAVDRADLLRALVALEPPRPPPEPS